MRLTTVLLIASLVQVSAATFGQNITLNEQNVSLESLFKKIRKQSGFNFYFDGRVVTPELKGSVKVTNVSIEEALKDVMAGHPLRYEIKDKLVIITRKEPSILESLISRFQEIDVTGKVTDESGAPLAGANIKVKGTSISTVADSEGKFTLKSVSEDAVLEVSFIGYESREIKAANVLNISLKMGTAKLEEVSVVSTGYQTLPKERATGSFVQLGEKELERNVGPDLISRLSGLTSSLTIDQRNGTGKTFLNIRGISTIFANDQPLIVVDNFPYNGDIGTINPNDIQDITILRDAAAASIWGVRAGNGVIVITTKRGKSDSPLNIGFNSNVTVGEKLDLFYQPSISSSDLIDVQSNLFEKGYYDGFIADNVGNPSLNPVVEILKRKRDGVITSQQAQMQIDALRNNDVRKDLEKYFYRNTLNQQYALNFSGGSQKHTYYLSTGYDNIRTTLIGNRNDRLSFNLQNTFNLTSKLSIDTRLAYTNSITDNKNNEGYFSGSLNQYARLVDDNGNPIPIDFRYRNDFLNTLPSKGFLDWGYNPIQEIGKTRFSGDRNNLIGAFGLSYKILNGLSADIKYQYETEKRDDLQLIAADSYYTRDLINSYSEFDGTSVTKRNIPLGAIRINSQDKVVTQNGRFQLNYNKDFLGKHRIDALAGIEIRETVLDGSSGMQYGLNTELGTFGQVDHANLYPVYPSMGMGSIPDGSDFRRTDDRYRSYFANLAYTYNGKYTLYSSGRIDQSNLFGVRTNQRSAPLWSIGAKWDIKNDLFSSSKFLSMLDIRATYGYSGNIDQTTTAFTTALIGQSSVSQLPMARLVSPPNPDLTWERTKMFNVGIDFGVLANRVSGRIEYYKKRGIDLIGSAYLDPTLGFPLFRGNVASMQGDGLDIEINSKNLEGPLQWETSFFFNKVSDKITDYKIEALLGAQLMVDASIDRLTRDYSPILGNPLFGIYSYPFEGLDPTTGDPLFFLNGVPTKDYAALSQNYKLSDLNFHGRATPSMSGALRNTLRYKKVSLSVNLVYRLGYFFREKSIHYGSLYSSNFGHSDYALRWQQPGDEKITNVPSEVYPADSQRDLFYYASSILVKKADNIRLQDIRLAYNLGDVKIGKTSFKQIEVYSYLNNVGVLWKSASSPLDPDNPLNAAQRTAAFGARIKF